jgi:hypothetical protein
MRARAARQTLSTTTSRFERCFGRSSGEQIGGQDSGPSRTAAAAGGGLAGTAATGGADTPALSCPLPAASRRLRLIEMGFHQIAGGWINTLRLQQRLWRNARFNKFVRHQ